MVHLYLYVSIYTLNVKQRQSRPHRAVVLPTHIHQNVQWYLNSSSMKIKPYAWQYSITFDLNNRTNSRLIYFKCTNSSLPSLLFMTSFNLRRKDISCLPRVCVFVDDGKSCVCPRMRVSCRTSTYTVEHIVSKLLLEIYDKLST